MGKTKSFFDYQNNIDYVQDGQTGDFINIKNGKRVSFSIKIKDYDKKIKKI